jgi:hypothetical protein
MSGITGAVVAGAVVAAGATAYAGSQQSKAAKSANAANAKNVSDTNQLNYELFRQGRGSEGSSLLPLYLERNGQTAEQYLGDQAYTAAQFTPSAAQTYADAQTIQRRYQPTIDAATGTVAGLYDGGLLSEEQSLLLPLANEREKAAATQRQSGLEALSATLNEIQAINRKRGFSGDSLSTNLVRSEARRRTAGDAANTLSSARIQNASDRFQLGRNDINRRVANVNLPFQTAQQAQGFNNFASNAVSQNEQNRQNKFNWFRIQPGAFQNAQLPQVQPVATNGQIAGQAVGALGGAAANYAANSYLANQYRNPAASNGYNVAIGGNNVSGLSFDQTQALFT